MAHAVKVLRSRAKREMGFYPYPGPPRHVRTTSPVRKRGTEMLGLSFESPLASGTPQNDVANARFFRRPGHDQGCPIVLLPGLFGERLSFWDPTAISLARRGFPTLLVGLPFLFERRPPGASRVSHYVSIDPSISLPTYEQAVADTRASLDWLIGWSEDNNRHARSSPPAVVGVSIGAFVSIITCAMEPRFRRLVAIFAGGDLDRIISEGSYGERVFGELRRYGITDKDRQRARLEYERYLDEVKKAHHPLDVKPTFHYFLFDPLTYAHHLRQLPILMFEAAVDPIVPHAATDRLWEALGKPEMCRLWGTHYIGGVWRPYVARRIARFLSRKNPERP
jgi:pimeloyl-ACP methyl ester carboxylesterase